MQNCRQASRPAGSSGIDARSSGTEFTQFLWLRHKRFFYNIIKPKIKNVKYNVKPIQKLNDFRKNKMLEENTFTCNAAS